MNKDRVMLVDGLNLFTRHFMANPAMTDNGEYVGGTVGFFNALMNLIEKCKPEGVIVVWEGGGSTKKRGLYSEYKKKSKPQNLNRYYEDDIPSTYQNRNLQIKLLTDLLSKIPVCQIYVENAEADDEKLKTRNSWTRRTQHSKCHPPNPLCWTAHNGAKPSPN